MYTKENQKMEIIKKEWIKPQIEEIEVEDINFFGIEQGWGS